ncbi:D-sedoheptulose-7-phosphate isomerase [Candidatus Electronema sp. JC]|jgi:D-sedoheptulose 7-phosphate isomerase|uniref:D-sedoheptulose-7-phosphate isomerase n=1 Tax=Candidatus Electronema sp. JC TaxID=3401570 RepID=UPI003B436740
MSLELVAASLAESTRAKEIFAAESAGQILALAGLIVATFRSGGKLLIFGNGGSAADAQHVAAEFVNRFLLNRPPLPAIALTTDTSVITAVGNDFSYDLIFVKQVQALGRPGDIALGISTSGTSPNVVKALAAAKEIGLKTAALTGGLSIPAHGVAQHSDLLLNVPSASTPRIQEAHLWIEHLLCELVEKELFGS